MEIQCRQCGDTFEQDVGENLCDDCEYQNTKKREITRLGDEAFKALHCFVWCQENNVPAPKFPLTRTAFAILNLAGRPEDISAACEKFISQVRLLMEQHKELENAENRA